MDILETEFKIAAVNVKQLKQTPTNEELLKLYGMYKYITDGPCIGEPPSFLFYKSHMKFMNWKNNNGKEMMEVMKDYINYVAFLIQKYQLM